MQFVTSMCMIKDNTELDRTLETTKFNKFELVNSPRKQPDMLSQELMGVVLAPANDTRAGTPRRE